MKTSRVPVVPEDDRVEEAATNILSPSLIIASFPIAGVGSLAASFDYASIFQNLSECLNTISLNVQQKSLDHQKDMLTLTGDFQAYREE